MASPSSRFPISILAGPGAALLAAGLALTPLLEPAERATQDWRFAGRGSRGTSAKIVLVGITDSTFEHWKDTPLLLWGPRFAAAIATARGLGASWIGLDHIQAASPDEALRRLGLKSVVPAMGGAFPDEQFRAALAAGGVTLAFTQLDLPNRTLLGARPDQSKDLGFIDTDWSAEAVRAYRAYRRREGKTEPSLAAAVALRLKKLDPADGAALKGLVPTGARLEDGSFWINYVGKPGAFPVIPMERVAEGDLSEQERAALQGAAVLLGPTDRSSNDVHPGPLGDYPGVEVHAHALATLLDGRPLKRTPALVEALITLGLAGALALLFTRLPIAGGAAAAAAAGAAWVGISMAAFRTDLLLPVAAPLLGIAGGCVLHYGRRSVEEHEARRFAEKLLGQHVSANVAKALLSDPDARALGGYRRDATVLFVDIESFTAWADTHTPEEVLAMLNGFHREMHEVIVRYGGTLDKYLGDGVMCFWNAPFRDLEHGLNGVAAAWAMKRAVDRLNRRARVEGRPEIRVRIGVNSGPVVVGNTGTEERHNYTVIGAAVHVAARLQGKNRDLHSTILIGEGTYDQVAASVDARRHVLDLPGIREPQEVYEVVEFRDPRGSTGPETELAASASRRTAPVNVTGATPTTRPDK